MNGAGDDLLAGAALAFDQDGDIAVGDLPDEPSDGAHGFAFAHEQAWLGERQAHLRN